jgi:uncharacterized Zn finger protein
MLPGSTLVRAGFELILDQQRLRRRMFDSEEEMKDALQEEWDKITQEEIQHRIADMNRKMRRTRTIKWRFSSRYISGNSDLLQI